MTDIKWGEPIAVDGNRPEWLHDGELMQYQTSDRTKWFDMKWGWGWAVIGGDIRLPASHPYYLATSRGFTYWPGGDSAPADWDGGEVLRRGGDDAHHKDPWLAPYEHNQRWFHVARSDFADIIGYRRKVEPFAAPLPADWAFKEAVRRVSWKPNPTPPVVETLIDKVKSNDTWRELARMIEKYEPELAPVDPDVLAVREILAARAEGCGYAPDAERYRGGECDDWTDFVAVLAAYRRVKSS